MDLDIAQYVQSKKDDITISYIKSDLSRAFTKIAGTDLLGVDMGVFVASSQEMLRQLETLRQLAITNNTSGASVLDLADIVTMNSPQEIKLQLQKTYNEQQSREERKLQIQEQQLQQNAEIATKKEQLADLRLDKTLASNERIAKMKMLGDMQDNTANPENNDIDYQKLALQSDASQTQLELARNKEILEKEKLIFEKQKEVNKLALENKKIDAKLEIENKNLEIVQAMKGKDIKEKNKKK